MAIKKFRVVLDGIAHEVEVEELGSAVVSSVPAPVVAPAPAAAPAGRKLPPKPPLPSRWPLLALSPPLSRAPFWMSPSKRARR